MNKYLQLRERAQAKWNGLKSSSVPVIYLGTASCGRAAGALDVMEAIKQTLEKHHLEARIITVGCIGPCHLEPIMDIALPGRARVSYGNVTPQKVRTILESYLIKGDPVRKLVLGQLKNGRGEPVEDIPDFFSYPMLQSQIRVVLRNCGVIDPEDIDHYLANDGYLGLMTAFENGPEWVLGEIREAGIRGRGGAGFPTAKKWEICRNQPGKDKYIICNADEGDPGAFMNRSLIEGDPHAVLEGLTIAGFTLGANHGYIYIRAEYPLAVECLRNAIDQMHRYGFLGRNIMGSDFNFEIKIKEGAGAFVCGEETALIASIEGRRGMPRARPPYPATHGLFGKPTVINNTETLGTLPNIVCNGGEWYRQFGTSGNPGTKTFSLVGKVKRTGLIEVPLGMTLRQIIFDVGGGTTKPFKAVQTGGPSGGCLSSEFLDSSVDYESLRSIGSIMGSGGLIVMDEDACVVDVARYFLKFTQKESCGKCVPCRVGTSHLTTMLDRISSGNATLEDLNDLEELSQTVIKGSLCGLGQTAPNPVLTTIRYFRNEYLEHIEQKYCRAGICRGMYEYHIDEKLCTGCMICLKACSSDAISGSRRQPHTIDLAKCIQCRACYLACKFDAIKVTPLHYLGEASLDGNGRGSQVLGEEVPA